MKRSIKGWDEQDLYTRWRHVYFWRRGERRKIKRRTHQRERREARTAVRDQVAEDEYARSFRFD